MLSFFLAIAAFSALLQQLVGQTELKYIVVKQTKTYTNAQAHCTSEYGTDLASIHSEEDNDVVKGLCIPTGQDCWIGLSDLDQEAVYKWADGTPFDYGTDVSGGVYPWASSSDLQPNDGDQFEDEDCVRLASAFSFDWGDIPCSSSYYFICNAYTLSPTPSPTSAPTTAPTTSPTSAPTPSPTFPTKQPSVAPSRLPTEIPTVQSRLLPTAGEDREGQVDESDGEDDQGENDDDKDEAQRNSSIFGGIIDSQTSVWMFLVLGLALLCCLFFILFILERRKRSKLKRELDKRSAVRVPSTTGHGASVAGSPSLLPPPVPLATMAPPPNPLLSDMTRLASFSSNLQNIAPAPASPSHHDGAVLYMQPAQSAALPFSFLSFQREQQETGEDDAGNEGVNKSSELGLGGTLQVQQNDDVDNIANEEDLEVDVDEIQMTAGGNQFEDYDADIASDEFVVGDDDDDAGYDKATGGWTKSS